METKSNALKDLNAIIIAENEEILASVKSNFADRVNSFEIITPCSPHTSLFNNKEIGLLIAAGSEKLLPLIKEVRSNLSNPILPFVWITPEESLIADKSSDVHLLLSDGEFDLYKVSKRISEIIKVINVFEQIPGDYTVLDKDKIFILRYMVSRDIMSVSPVIYLHSKYGYIFPALFTISQSEVFSLLSEMESKRMLKGELIDKVRVCKNCGSAHITLREVCPNCGSPDIRIEDYIHHFRCGYLGPESDFKVPGSDKLICPKCKRELKHIGVDYDRPSKTFVCNKCGSVFEEPDYTYLCFNCGETFGTDEVKRVDIKQYVITNIGQDTAFSGSLVDAFVQSVAETDQRFMPYNTFKIILEHERKRAGRYGVKSCLLDMHVVSSNLSTLELYEIINDIVSLLKLTLRETDIVSMSGRHIFILLAETPCRKIGPLKKRIEERLNVISELKTDRVKILLNSIDVK